MERTESKFMLNVTRIPEFLLLLQADYRVLDLDTIRIQRYESLYFDTKDFQLYMAHHSGRASRIKIRARKYVESQTSFLEVKTRSNRGRTLKERISITEVRTIIPADQGVFLKSKTLFRPSELESKLWSDCSRITLIHKDRPERITIDFEIRFRQSDQTVQLPHLAIIEIKQIRASTSLATRVLRQMGIRQISLSKYCLGVVKLYSGVRKNNFKPLILQLNKIKNESHA